MRLLPLVLGVSISMSGTQATAQQCRSADLWPSARLGMSKAEFRAAFPSGKVDIVTGCAAYIDPKFKDGALTKVELTRVKTVVGCPSKIEADYSARFGRPNSDVRYQPTAFFGALPLLSMKTTVKIWTDDCALIALHQPAEGDRSFTVIYQAKSDPSAPQAW